MAEEESKTDAEVINNNHKISTDTPHNKYYNSSCLSDIVIRYGNNGEQVLFGHRYHLAIKSRWFEKAFAGNFKEATAKEITLMGDDPEAIEGMFRHMYGKTIQWPTNNATKDNVLFCTSLYVVAEKYFCASFEDTAVAMFSSWLTKLVDTLGNDEDAVDYEAAAETLSEIVIETYKHEGEPTTEKKPLVKALVKVFISHPFTDPFGYNDTRRFGEVIDKVAAEISSFGRDLYLALSFEKDVYRHGYRTQW